jgi:Tol biopolymer transport system component
MPLTPGDRLGPYDIIAPIGAGGMGEVYRARDMRLKRDVALKILPESFATDPERLARFQREAEVLASLNHPHIAAIYGIEESGNASALVMELVEGPTLADRIAQGPIPVDEALPIAKQIAEALEAAHEQGIIHRDLKPANIKLRTDGAVKVLDFGLAKMIEPASARGIDATASPTITSPAMMTGVGVLLGTAAYMSPEQARGMTIDQRADIWAFGCVLYEMRTGTRAFAGEDVSVTLAGVIRGEPVWPRLPADVTPTVASFLKRCLEKDRKNRVRHIGDMRLALEGAFDSRSIVPSSTQFVQGRVAASLIVAFVLGVLLSAGIWVWSRPTASSATVARLRIVPPTPQVGTNSEMVLARDGKLLVYSATGEDAVVRLHVRHLATIEPTPIAGTEGASDPALSPDAAWVAFEAAGQIKKIALAGGPPVLLAEAPTDVYGMDWTTPDVIILGSSEGLWRLPAIGGAPELIAKIDPSRKETGYRFPRSLPDGRAIVFSVWGGARLDENSVEILSLQTGRRQRLASGFSPRVTNTGHLVFVRSNTLWVAPLDPQRLTITNEPVPIPQNVMVNVTGLAQFDLATDGTLAYWEYTNSGQSQRLAWIDRSGQTTPAIDQFDGIYHPPLRISPDGRRLLLTRHPTGGEDDVVAYDLERGVPIPIDNDPRSNSRYGIWTPDGQHITFASTRRGSWDLYSVSTAGGSSPEPLLIADGDQRPLSWSPDGRVLLFWQSGGSASDIWAMTKGGQASPLIATPYNEQNATFSPDGRWVAYQSNESGRSEVYVQPYPGPGEKIRISATGGTEPVWGAGGKQLYYRAGSRRVIAVPVTAGNEFRVGSASEINVTLDSGSLQTNYDVSPDGSRLIGILQDDLAPPSIVLVQNWSEELKRLLPTN